MKYLLLILMACGQDYTLTKSPDLPPYACTVTQIDEGSLIACPDGSTSVVTNGQNGHHGVSIKGDKGDSGTDGLNGTNGTNGIDGQDGANGLNGHNSIIEIVNTSSCSNEGYTILAATDLNDNGTIENTDTNLQSVQVCNGNDGAAGVDGQDGTNGTNGQDAPPTQFTPVGLVDPCSDKPGIYDEVFLRLANGTLLASFSDNANGANTRWSVLTTGNYITTDGSHCYFSINNAGNLYNEHY